MDTMKLKQRPFAYSDVYIHPDVDGCAFNSGSAHIKEDIPDEIARLCKNESNCTVFLKDGTWLTTWGQGSSENSPRLDEGIVFSTSRDMGKTWTEPQRIISSTDTERIAYGVPFVVPETDRIYIFFFAGRYTNRGTPEFGSGRINYIFSDDLGENWSCRNEIQLPDRDVNAYPDYIHGWVNHPPFVTPSGDVLLPISCNPFSGTKRRTWRLGPAECSVIRCDNIRSQTDPEKLSFTLLPQGPRGIRVDPKKHMDNPALNRLCDFYDGSPAEIAFNFQELTIASLEQEKLLGIGRTFLGSPGYTISNDSGQTWSAVEPLRYGPDGELVKHPMTMCPIAQTTDGRYVLLFTNNDGTDRSAQHVWDGRGKTRNPQWFAVGRYVPDQEKNGGMIFGKPRILAEVDDTGETNLKTGMSMPQFFESNGRYFIMYNSGKEFIHLDEIPAEIMDEMTP